MLLKGGQHLFYDALATASGITYTLLETPTGKVLYQKGADNNNDGYDIPTLLESGTYSLTLHGGANTGNYSFRLLEYGASFAFSASQATPVNLNQNLSDSFGDANGLASNFYRFTVSANQAIDVNVVKGAYPNGWSIYSPDGKLIASSSFNSTDQQINLPQAGEYTLEVYAAGLGDKNYNIRLLSLSLSTYAYNLGTIVTGNIDKPSESQTYTFNGTVAQELFFNALYGNSNIRAQLYSPTGVLEQDNNTASDWGLVTLKESGSYKLVISGNGSSTGNYSFNLLDLAAAPTLKIGDTADKISNGVNLYQLAGSRGKVYKFDLNGSQWNGANWVLYDPSGAAIDTPSPSSPDFQVVLGDNGIYVLAVQGASTTSINYGFTVTDITPAIVTSSGLNSLQSGTINYLQVIDNQFTATAGTWIYLDNQSSSNNIQTQLFNPDGTKIFDGNSASDYGVLLLTQTGTYDLQLLSYDSSSVTYQYKILQLPTQAAGPGINYLQLGSITNGTLGANESKIYVFQGETGLHTLINGMYGQYINATIYDANGHIVLQDGSNTTNNSNSSGFNFNDTGSVTLTNNDLYYLVLSNSSAGSQDYSFQLQDMDLSPELVSLQSYTGTFSDGRQSTVYKLHAEAGDNLYFKMQSLQYASGHDDGNRRWKLYGPGNNLFFDQYLLYNASVTISQTGDYYLYVAGGSDSVPITYNFSYYDNKPAKFVTTIVPGTGVGITRDPNDDSLGSFSVKLAVKDIYGNSGFQDYQIKLHADPSNANPVITSTADNKFDLRKITYRYQVTALDPNGDQLNYRLISSPTGSLINSETGELLWVPDSSLTSASTANFTVEVDDGRGGKDTQSFTVTTYAQLGTIQGAVFDDLNNNGLLDTKLIKGDNPSIVFVLDDSGSTIAPFYDSDGKRVAGINSVLDAEKAAVKANIQAILSQSAGSKVKISIITFDSNAIINNLDPIPGDNLKVYATALDDVDNNGVPDVYQVLDSIKSGGATDYSTVIPTINSLVKILPGTPNVVFMSDGYTRLTRTGAEFATLKTIGAQLYSDVTTRGGNLTGLAVGNASLLISLQAIDPNALQVTSVSELLNIFSGFDPRFALEPYKEGVTVYLDTNNDGVFEPGEPYVITKKETTFNTLGNTEYEFTFNNLVPGTYKVRILTPSGYTNTNTASFTDTVTLSGETYNHLIGVSKGPDVVHNAPYFTVSPPTLTTLHSGNVLKYQASALDPDGNPLTYALILAPQGMAIDSTTGAVIWSVTKQQVVDAYKKLADFNSFLISNGRGAYAQKYVTYNVLVTAKDSFGGQALQYLNVELAPDINPPVVTSNFPNINPEISKPFTYQVKATSPDNNALTFSLLNPPAGASINPNTGLLTWTPSNTGNVNFTLRVSDSLGSIIDQTIQTTVVAAQPNVSPVITSSPRIVTRVGNDYFYQILASDPANTALTYSLTTGPTGMQIKDNVISWVPSADQSGDNQVVLKVTDALGLSTSQSFTIKAAYQAPNASPVITSTPTIFVTSIGRVYQYDATGFDSNGDETIWSLNSAPDGAVIEPNTGALRWTPKSTELGDNTFSLRLTDSYGGYVEQEFQVTLSDGHLPPHIVSAANTSAGLGQVYSYQVVATAPENDPLTYQLVSQPVGMTIDKNTGLIQWNPTTTGTYNVEVLAQDNQGGTISQAYKLVVGSAVINHPPSITSTPALIADINKPYQYQVTATDSNVGDVLTYKLIDNGGIAGLSINSNTGLLSGNVTAGTYQVVVGVVTQTGLGAAQSYTLTAINVQPPVISSTNPPITATPDVLYSYDVIASDPAGTALAYSLDANSIAKGMTIDSNGRLRWTPTQAEIGNQAVTIAITDAAGAVTTQNFNINVQADTIAPTVKLAFTGTVPAALGSSITFQVEATDNVKVADLQLLVAGLPVVLDASGSATVVLNQVGNIPIVAQAIDEAGNVGKDSSVSISVFDPTAPVNAPKVSLDLSGFTDNTISSLSNIKGMVTDPTHNLLSYVLEVAPVGTDNWTTVFTGNSEVVLGGVLGKFDPSVMADDSYRIRLTATDTTGISSSTEEQINVVSQGLKLGNFTVSFTDLSIPVAGLQITVARTYDSLNATNSDDFGFGWRLEFRDTDLRTSLGPDPVFAQTGLRTQAFQDGTKVFITLPGGKREAFTFKPTVDPLSKYFPPFEDFDTAFYHPAFVAENGSTSTLTVVDKRLSHVNGKYYYALGSGVPYNPADAYFGNQYILTTKEGIVYEIDGTTGKLLTVTNPNGNKLTFTDAGITSDTGQSVSFGRDASGRIVSVTDPLGKQVKYQYDAKGDLVAVTDRDSNTTQFVYDVVSRPHYLDGIRDPLNRMAVKTQYDDQGRLIQTVDAFGKSVQFAYDSTDQLETVKDALGNSTTYVYDERGNVITEVDAYGGKISRTYDDNNNLLKQVDADGVTVTYTYDNNKNPLTVTDGDGNTTRITYNQYSEILSLISPGGLSVTSTYDARGNLLSRTNTDGQTTKFDYDGYGRLVKQTAPDGEVSSYVYDTFGNPTTFTDSRGNQSIATYDKNGKVTHLSLVFPFENQTLNTSYTYDDAGRTTSITDAQGNVSTTEYDANGNVIATVDSKGNRTQYFYNVKNEQIKEILPDNTPNNPDDNPAIQTEYDANGKMISQTSTTGLKTSYVYDVLGRLTQTIYPDLTPNDNSDNPKDTVQYTAAGRVKTKTDIYGNRTVYTYDELGRVVQEQDFFGNPLGNDTTTTYNVDGQVTSITDARHRTTQFGFDVYGRPSQTTYFDGTTSQITYDNFGRTQTKTNQLGQITSYSYDTFGKVASVTNALNQTTLFSYNSRGSLVAVIDANNHTTKSEYDLYNRQTAVINANGERSETTYNQYGQVIATKDANGYTTQYTYDNLGELTSVKLANQATTTYGYDNLGRQTSLIDANGNKTTYKYDAFNRKVGTTLPLGQSSTTVFNNLGETASTTDFNGNVINYTYDQYGRLASKSFSNPRVATVSYTYDPLTSQVKTITDGRGVTTYGFDSYDRVNSITNPDGQTVGYVYDVLGNLTTLTTSNSQFNYTYDKLNRLDKVFSNGALTKYSYDAVGNLLSTELGDGTTETRTYDASNRLTGMLTLDASGVVLSSYNYTLDGMGNRTLVVENTGRTVNYTYNVVNQLTQESIVDPTLGNRTIIYTYDLVGNRLKRGDSDANGGISTYVYDANNRLSSQTTNAKVTTFTYDNNGSTLSANDGTNSVVYQWIDDGENRLISVTSMTAGVSSWTQYVYDASGNRVASITDGVRTNYLLDPRGNAQVLLEYDASGKVLTKYVYGWGLIESQTGTNVSFYHTDALGSTRFLTDASGQVTERYIYDASGRLLDSTGSSPNVYEFAGQQRDGTGLDYLRARYYDSNLGRFISKDVSAGNWNNPISQNPYVYANDNPIIFTDPSGYFSLEDISVAEALNSILSGISYTTIGQQIIVGALFGGAFDLVHQDIEIIEGRRAEVSWSGVLESTYQGAILGPLLAIFPLAGVAFAAKGILYGIEEIKQGNILSGFFDIAAGVSPLVAKEAREPLSTEIEKLSGLLAPKNVQVTLEQKGVNIEFNPETNCFTAGTEVLTPTGEKDIKDVKVGDDVLAEDPITGKVETHKVLQTFVHEVTNILDIHVGNETISTTTTHLFWVVDKGWIEAKDLHQGYVLQEENGKQVTVKDITQRSGDFKVYNFEVQGLHTYFVSDLGVLVHNDCTDIAKNWEAEFEQSPEGISDGHLITIRPNTKKYPGAQVLPKPQIGELELPWSYHDVFVRDGYVYDEMGLGTTAPMKLKKWLEHYGDDVIITEEPNRYYK